MVNVKKFNENRLDRLLKDVTVSGEEIRSVQDEKQSVMDEFRKEHDRFKKGQISKQAFAISTRDVTNELAALDTKIRENIKKAMSGSRKTHMYISSQAPEKIRASTSGLHKTVSKRAKAKPAKAKKSRKARPKKKAVRKAARKSKAARPNRARKARPKKKAARPNRARKAKKSPAKRKSAKKRSKR